MICEQDFKTFGKKNTNEFVICPGFRNYHAVSKYNNRKNCLLVFCCFFFQTIWHLESYSLTTQNHFAQNIAPTIYERNFLKLERFLLSYEFQIEMRYQCKIWWDLNLKNSNKSVSNPVSRYHRVVKWR